MRRIKAILVSVYGHPRYDRVAVFVGFCLLPLATLPNLEIPQPYGLAAAIFCTAMAPLAMIVIMHGLSPKHWVEVGHEFDFEDNPLARYEEMLAWIKRNASGRYKFTGSGVIFAHSADAVAYKLKWTRST